MKKIILITALLTPYLLLASATANTPPEAKGTKFIPEDMLKINQKGELEQSTTSPNIQKDRLLGDDTLPKEEFDTGVRVKRNLGHNEGEVIIDKDGNSYLLKDKDKGISKDNSALHQTEEEAIKKEEKRLEWYKEYQEYVKTNDREAKIEKEREAKGKARDLTHERKNTVKGIIDYTLKGKDHLSESETISNKFRNLSEVDTDHASERFLELDKNATEFYKELYGRETYKSDSGLTLKVNKGVLSEAYNKLPTLQKQLTDRLKSPIIKCQISRELIPAWYCPLDGMDGFRFPGNLPASLNAEADKDFTYVNSEGQTVTEKANPELASIQKLPSSLRKTNLVLAEQACNSYCWTKPGANKCIREKKISSDEIKMPTDTISVFPTYKHDSSSVVVKVNNVVPVNKITFKVKIEKTSNDLTDEEWKEKIRTSDLKLRYSVLEIPSDTKSGLSPITIVDRAMIRLNKEEFDFTVPVGRQMDILQVKFWKPYITSNPIFINEYEHVFEELKKIGATITISELKGKYASDSFYYCPMRQLVSLPGECGTTKVKKINYGATGSTNHMYLCLSDQFKIGPEAETGAFFDEESCENACIRNEKCLTTYSHYKGKYGAPEVLYKAEIDCVDDPSNSECTKEKCENLFKDHEKRPINEIVVQGDNINVFTIKNRTLTNEIRPKLNLEEELKNGKKDYDEMFDTEQKDAAYLYMIKNLTMNTIKYPIGTPSPHNLAYNIQKTGAKELGDSYSIDLKPNSFDTNKMFYVYAVARMDQFFSPQWGSYYVKPFSGYKGYVTAKAGSGIKFKDYTYLIRNPYIEGQSEEKKQNWKVFRKEEYAEVWYEGYENVIQPDGSVKKVAKAVWQTQPDGGLIKPYFGEYDLKTDAFKHISPTQQAPYLSHMKFSNTEHFYRFVVTRNHAWDLFDTYGSLMRNQEPLDNESKMRKLYSPEQPIHNMRRGQPFNFVLYLLYSDKPLNYHQIMVEIEGENYEDNTKKVRPQDNKWGAYSMLSPALFRSGKVKDDGELNNNIDPFILGKPEHNTIISDWEPSISEKGKKVFKFMFIYDDKTVDPFQAKKEGKPDRIEKNKKKPLESDSIFDNLGKNKGQKP